MKDITVDPEILGGIPVFTGTRVPVQNLFDYLEAGDSVAEFIENFPEVAREEAIAVLEASKTSSFGPDAKPFRVESLKHS